MTTELVRYHLAGGDPHLHPATLHWIDFAKDQQEINIYPLHGFSTLDVYNTRKIIEFLKATPSITNVVLGCSFKSEDGALDAMAKFLSQQGGSIQSIELRALGNVDNGSCFQCLAKVQATSSIKKLTISSSLCRFGNCNSLCQALLNGPKLKEFTLNVLLSRSDVPTLAAAFLKQDHLTTFSVCVGGPTSDRSSDYHCSEFIRVLQNHSSLREIVLQTPVESKTLKVLSCFLQKKTCRLRFLDLTAIPRNDAPTLKETQRRVELVQVLKTTNTSLLGLYTWNCVHNLSRLRREATPYLQRNVLIGRARGFLKQRTSLPSPGVQAKLLANLCANLPAVSVTPLFLTLVRLMPNNQKVLSSHIRKRVLVKQENDGELQKDKRSSKTQQELDYVPPRPRKVRRLTQNDSLSLVVLCPEAKDGNRETKQQ